MARTIKEIANGMKSEFIGNEDLCTAFGLTYDSTRDEDGRIAYYDVNFSLVSVETCLIFIVATCAAALENMFDWFKEDVDNVIANERYGHKGWYETTAKEFEYYGDKIISHASCEELNIGVKLKIAKGTVGNLEQLNAAEQLAFATYINRIKPAGIPVQIINQPADDIKINMDVYYDPVVFDADDAMTAVKNGISHYLQNIDFNGVYTSMGMVDYLQSINGLEVIEVDEVKTKSSGEGSYSPIENGCRSVPVSGYYVLDDDSDIRLHIVQ